mgnify:FL=1
MTADELRDALEDALSRGKVYVHLNPKIDGVILPSHLMDRDSVPLVMAWQAPGIDLVLGVERIEATLRFGGKPFRCCIPWRSLLAIVADHPGEADREPELQGLQGHDERNSDVSRPRPSLKLIKS